MSKEKANQQQKILILAAIPGKLRLDKEIREIEDSVRRANKRDLFDIKTRTAVRAQDIRRAIAEEKPQIVHFCGHGLEDGSLLLEDEEGHNKSVSPEGLASLFQLHANYVNCVLINACYSAKTAEAIRKYINYAIGMNQPIGDKAAIAFAQGFYDGLGYAIPDNQDVFQRAFEEGKVAIQLEISNSMKSRKMTVVNDNDEPVKIPEHLIPVLLKNPKLELEKAKRINSSSVSKVELEDSERETLADILKRSGRASHSARKALCIEIGVDFDELDFGQAAPRDFALELVSYLNRTGNTAALLKLCQVLAPKFHGRYANDLVSIQDKLQPKTMEK